MEILVILFFLFLGLIGLAILGWIIALLEKLGLINLSGNDEPDVVIIRRRTYYRK